MFSSGDTSAASSKLSDSLSWPVSTEKVGRVPRDLTPRYFTAYVPRPTDSGICIRWVGLVVCPAENCSYDDLEFERCELDCCLDYIYIWNNDLGYMDKIKVGSET